MDLEDACVLNNTCTVMSNATRFLLSYFVTEDSCLIFGVALAGEGESSEGACARRHVSPDARSPLPAAVHVQAPPGQPGL